jgi:membrane-associated phospholipid phosphatase
MHRHSSLPLRTAPAGGPPADGAASDRGWRSAARRAAGWRVELSWFLAAYVTYNVGRFVFAGELQPAREHAHWIVDLEASMGVAVERAVQDAMDSSVASIVLSNVYLLAQLVVVPIVLVWLYRRSRPVYRQLRNTVVVTWILSVPIHAMFPVAPPRLAGLDFIDTVSAHGAVGLTGRSTLFYNQFAAVPSLHVGFAFAVSVALAVALGDRRAKALALLWGPLVTLAVVATGNHYVFDVAAGIVVTALALVVGHLVSRRTRTPAATGGGRTNLLGPIPCR